MFVTNPNSPQGLIFRAELLEERFKLMGQDQYLFYAYALREIAAKKYPAWKNKELIKKYLRRRTN
jgi:hypothetical protein